MTQVSVALAKSMASADKLHAALAKAGYNPDQERDDHGRWSRVGAAIRSGATTVRHAIGRGVRRALEVAGSVAGHPLAAEIGSTAAAVGGTLMLAGALRSQSGHLHSLGEALHDAPAFIPPAVARPVLRSNNVFRAPGHIGVTPGAAPTSTAPIRPSGVPAAKLPGNVISQLLEYGYSPDSIGRMTHAEAKRRMVMIMDEKLGKALAKAGYKSSQARDDHGRWTVGGAIRAVGRGVGRGLEAIGEFQGTPTARIIGYGGMAGLAGLAVAASYRGGARSVVSRIPAGYARVIPAKGLDRAARSAQELDRALARFNSIKAPGTVGSVPFMITRDMKQQLADKGYKLAHIKSMTPAQAHAALGKFFVGVSA
jgi:hypothetical protein